MSDNPFPNHLVAMLEADGATTQPTVFGDLIRQQFEGDRRIRQTESVWVPDPGGFPGAGHWEVVEETDAGPAAY